MADFFTKPLQGQLFTMFRDFIMNVASSNVNAFWNHRSVLNIVYVDDRSEKINEGHKVVEGTITGYEDQDGFTTVTRKRHNKGQFSKAVSKTGSKHKQVSERIKTGKKTESKG